MHARAHFWFNKYLISPFSSHRYYLSYDVKHRALWFRTAKVASRSIDQYFRDACGAGGYYYSSRVGYAHVLYRDWFKFAFVRHPVDRLVSAWKDKVVEHNMYAFAPEELARMQDLGSFVDWLAKQNVDECDEHLQVQHRQIDMQRIDFVGRFERFDSDFAHVANSIGLPLTAQHHLNATKPRALEMDQSLRQKIAAIYHRDMELFYPEG